MQHTSECLHAQGIAHDNQVKYGTAWPDYCRSCDALGGRTYPGTYVQPPEFDTCPKCIELGKCPRCGFQHPEDSPFTNGDALVCTQCGWDLDNPDAAPGDFECFGECTGYGMNDEAY